MFYVILGIILITNIKGLKMINEKNIKDIFNYQDGELLWKIHKKGNKGIDSIAGSFSDRYKKVIYCQKSYQIHRLIWIWHNGDIPKNMVIDHIDNIKLNNKIDNLRLVTQTKNCHNRKGEYGVTKYYTNPKNTDKVKYRATLIENGNRHNLGVYNTEKEAREAYEKAKTKYHCM